MTPTLPAVSNYADPGTPMLAPLGASPRPRLRLLQGGAQSRHATGAQHARDRACRAINVAVALLGLILAAPLMFVIAALIRLTSPGPAIYRQPRVGMDRRRARGDRRQAGRAESGDSRRKSDQGGRIFTIYKFRTMRSDRPKGQVWASKDDPRITPVGRVLRATRLDEVPQLLNVLKGDMNIVGPRPEQPEIFQQLSREVENYRDRQRVLPGITGLAQVNMGYDQCLDDVRKKVGFDLQYIQRRSAAEDLLIMAKTMPVMVFRRVWM